MKECYAVFIGFGQYEDYHADLRFVTFSKEQAQNWVNKYNKIVENNFERLDNFNIDESLLPLYYQEIIQDEAHAFFEKTKVR